MLNPEGPDRYTDSENVRAFPDRETGEAANAVEALDEEQSEGQQEGEEEGE